MPPKKKPRKDLIRLEEKCVYGFLKSLEVREELRRYFVVDEESNARGNIVSTFFTQFPCHAMSPECVISQEASYRTALSLSEVLLFSKIVRERNSDAQNHIADDDLSMRVLLRKSEEQDFARKTRIIRGQHQWKQQDQLQLVEFRESTWSVCCACKLM